MTCTDERQRQLGELAGGRLPFEALDELLEHVESCPACSAALDLTAALVAAEDARPEVPSRNPWRWAAAAGVLLAVGLAFSSGGRRSNLRSLADLTPLVPPSSVLRSQDPIGVSVEAWETAMERFRSEDWRAAAEQLGAFSAAGDDRALVGLYEGLARLQLDELARGAEVLESAADRSEGLLQQRCLWYAAQARLALEDGERARALLARLVALGAEFAPNARALLGRLDRIGGGS